MIRITLDPNESVIVSGVGAIGRDVVVTNRDGRLESKLYAPDSKPERDKLAAEEYAAARNEQRPCRVKPKPTLHRKVRVSELVDASGWVSADLRKVFLANLAEVERDLDPQHFKGITRCSICAKSIGPSTMYGTTTGPEGAEVTTVWPIELGYHFVKKHDCVPPSWFVVWVNAEAAKLKAERKKKVAKKKAG